MKSTTKQRIRAMFEALQEASIKKGINFTITLSRFTSLAKAKTCAYSGHPFDDNLEVAARTAVMVDPKKGYVKGNVVFVKARYNFNCPSQDKFTACFDERRVGLKTKRDGLTSNLVNTQAKLSTSKATLVSLKSQAIELEEEIAGLNHAENILSLEVTSLVKEVSELDVAEEGCKKLQNVSFFSRMKLKMRGRV